MDGGLKNPFKGVGSKISGFGKGIKDKATGARDAYMFNKAMKQGQKSLGKLPSIPTDKTTDNSLFKIVVLIIVSLFLGIFFIFISKKDPGQFKYTQLQQGLSIAAIVIVALGITFFLKINIIDFLVSSQINIICTYLLISYIGVTSLFSSGGFFSAFTNFFKDLWTIMKDPTEIFKNGFRLIIPLFLLIIPLLVLLYTATKSPILSALVLAVSVSVVYILSPKTNGEVISGGLRLESQGKSWYDII